MLSHCLNICLSVLCTIIIGLMCFRSLCFNYSVYVFIIHFMFVLLFYTFRFLHCVFGIFCIGLCAVSP
jgi:hypothetical protein